MHGGNSPNTVLEQPSMAIFVDEAHIKKQRAKARELKKSQWWKQQIGPGICFHCKEKFLKEDLCMDHLLPVSRGGLSTKRNVVPSCKPCNSEKAYHSRSDKVFEEWESGSDSE